MSSIAGLLNTLLGFLALAIIIRAILSWFPIDPRHPVVTFFNRVTEPVLQPIRRLMPRTWVIDLSPMIAIVLILILQWILRSAIQQGVP